MSRRLTDGEREIMRELNADAYEALTDVPCANCGDVCLGLEGEVNLCQFCHDEEHPR